MNPQTKEPLNRAHKLSMIWIAIASVTCMTAVLTYWHNTSKPSGIFVGRIKNSSGEDVARASISWAGNQITPPTYSDTSGRFRISTQGVSDPAHLVVEKPGYVTWDRIVNTQQTDEFPITLDGATSIPAPISPLPSTSSPPREWQRKVARQGVTSTGIFLEKGDHLQVNAKKGQAIKVGEHTPLAGPDGVAGNDFGIDLGRLGYNIRPDYNHAAILYKVGDDRDWALCGSRLNTKAEESGELLFRLNDKSDGEGDIDASFQITVSVQRK